MVFVSVDVEACGCIPSEYSLLSIGACVLDNPQNSFYIELKPEEGKPITPSAYKVVGDLYERAKQTGIDPLVAMKHFAAWLESLNDRVVMVGFNVVFDWQFINYYFVRFLGYNPFGINALDIKAYAAGKLNCEFYETTKKRLRGRGLRWEGKHTHVAVEDAVEQANLFNMLRKI